MLTSQVSTKKSIEVQDVFAFHLHLKWICIIVLSVKNAMHPFEKKFQSSNSILSYSNHLSLACFENTKKTVFDYKVQLCNLRGHSMSVSK